MCPVKNYAALAFLSVSTACSHSATWFQLDLARDASPSFSVVRAGPSSLDNERFDALVPYESPHRQETRLDVFALKPGIPGKQRLAAVSGGRYAEDTLNGEAPVSVFALTVRSSTSDRSADNRSGRRRARSMLNPSATIARPRLPRHSMTK